MENAYPTRLDGYQQIVFGAILPDDFVIKQGYSGSKACAWAKEVRLSGKQSSADRDLWLGFDPETNLPEDYRVYRKIACPTQQGSHYHHVIGPAPEPSPWQTVVSAGEDVTTKAKTYDDGKPPLAHLPWDALREVAMVQAYGQSKYGDFYNYKKGMELSRNLSCAIRHITDFMDGDDLDDESGRSHLAHAACRVLFALQNIKDGVAIDDRYRP